MPFLSVSYVKSGFHLMTVAALALIGRRGEQRRVDVRRLRERAGRKREQAGEHQRSVCHIEPPSSIDRVWRTITREPARLLSNSQSGNFFSGVRSLQISDAVHFLIFICMRMHAKSGGSPLAIKHSSSVRRARMRHSWRSTCEPVCSWCRYSFVFWFNLHKPPPSHSPGTRILSQTSEGIFFLTGRRQVRYTTTIDVGNVTSYFFEEPNPSVQYFLALRAYDTERLISPYSNEAVTTPNPPLTITDLSANRMSPQPVGTSIVFTATASGGAAPYQFKWWIDNGGTSTVGQQWSTSNTFTWTPTSPSSTYVIRVWARNATSTADAPDSSAAILTMTFAITGAAANVAPTVNAGADQTITLPDTAALSATVSDDGEPAPPGVVTFTWALVSGPGTVAFSAPSAASTTVTFSTSGTYGTAAHRLGQRAQHE